MLEQTAPPIILHGLWRSSSTYVWSKFRENEGLRCFAKPFHHSLAKPAEDLTKDFSQAANRFGFTNIKRSYYDEYDAGPNGVHGYNWRFTVENYAMDQHAQNPTMEEYLTGLIQKSRNQSQRPVLKFNRGVLRAQWLNEKLSAQSLYINRSPTKIYESYKRLASDKTSYYLACLSGIIGVNSDHPLFQEIADHLNIKKHDTETFRRHFTFYNRVSSALTDQQSQDIVGFFWTLGMVNAMGYAHDCLDMELSADHGDKTPKIFSKIVERHTGAEVSFSDLALKEKEEDLLSVSAEMKKIIQGAITHLKLPEKAWQRFDNFTLAHRTRRQLARILD